LTWLSEKKESVFVVATANDVSGLPPELLRKGRFDEVFFVDLPSQAERSAIIQLHLSKREITANISCDELAEHTEGFSGAELEQLIVSALYECMASKSQISTDMLLQLAAETRPLSVLMREKILALRQWSQGRTVLVA
jgi:SpoVK/Ycf46/Vps4 family AAA+-type ATPase